MTNDEFAKLLLIIFNQTLGIKKYNNNSNFRAGNFPELFTRDQLANDLATIQSGKDFSLSSIYFAAIDQFFELPQDKILSSVRSLFDELHSNRYVDNIMPLDLFEKCDANTLPEYKTLLKNLLKYYNAQYQDSILGKENYQIYTISKDAVENILKKYTEFHLPVKLDYYLKQLPYFLNLIKTKNPDLIDINNEYIYFFKNVLENNLFKTLSFDEKKVFFDTLYVLSDILDKKHHEDSYKINLNLLIFYNHIYNDYYLELNIDDIRKIQGCIYAIAINPDENSLIGNIKLTNNGNLTATDHVNCPITRSEKYELCLSAMLTLLKNVNIIQLDEQINSYDNSLYLKTFEGRLKKKSKIFKKSEINDLYVLSLIYSNIATIYLQFLIHCKTTSKSINDSLDLCKRYQEKNHYIRYLYVRINALMYNNDSSEYKDSVYYFSNFYHSLATRLYHQKKYAICIMIRSVLYQYYLEELNSKEKANMQLQLSPISQYEKSQWSAQDYEKEIKESWKICKKDFKYFNIKSLVPYDEFKSIVIEYEKYKKFI